MSKLSAVEQRTVKLAGSDSKGLTPEKALAQLIQDKGMGKGRIGLDHFAIPITQYEKIRANLPQAKLLPASMFFRYVRMIKTADEIQRLREAAEVNEAAIKSMLRACRPRVTENELASIYKGEIAKAGGQVYWMHMAVSPRRQLSRDQRQRAAEGRYFPCRHGLLDQRLSCRRVQVRLRRRRADGGAPQTLRRHPSRRVEVGGSAETGRPSARTLRNHDRRRARQRPAELFQLLPRPHDWIGSARVSISARSGGRTRRSVSCPTRPTSPSNRA